MYEITFIESGKTEYLDYEEAVELLGTDLLEEALSGHTPHIVAIEVDGDDEPDVGEAQEWYDFDPDC